MYEGKGICEMNVTERYVNQMHMLQYSLNEQLLHGMRVSNLAYHLAKELELSEDF